MKFIQYLIKPASGLCNLRCRYCFYTDVCANRSQANLGVMSDDTVISLLTRTAEACERGGKVSFAFQGGEPTIIGVDFYRRFIDKAREILPRDVSVSWSIQTNGLLIDNEWTSLLHSNNFLVGLSLDGTPDIHDFNRIDVNDKGSWKSAERAARLLISAGVDINALCVVTKQCASHPRAVYNRLKKTGFKYMQFIPCMDPIGEEHGERVWSLNAADYSEFLCSIFELWHADWEKGDYIGIRTFEDYVYLMLGMPPGTCAACGDCGGYLVIEADGGVYPCDYYALDEWRMGSIIDSSLSELMSNEVLNRFIQRSNNKPTECSYCRYLSICRGGCPHDWVIIKDGSTFNRFCKSYKTFFEREGQRLANVARMESDVRRRAAYTDNRK